MCEFCVNMTTKANASEQKAQEKRKVASLYDAVAGRVGYGGFLTEQQPSKYRDTASTSFTPVPPEEVLFRRKGAPSRFEENDVYWADRHLEAHQRLPESETVKAVHTYLADFYSTAMADDGQQATRSMDETALLTLGILLEEAAAQALGKTADLVFVEPSQDRSDDEDVNEIYQYNGQGSRSVFKGIRYGRELTQGRSRSAARTTRVTLRPRPENHG